MMFIKTVIAIALFANCGSSNLSGKVPDKPENPKFPGMAGHYLVAPKSVDLDKEGTTDWLIWNFDKEITSIEKKKSNAISGLSKIGNGTIVSGIKSPTAFSGQNGESIAYSGVKITGDGNGFRFTVPADRKNRTLRIYCSAENAGGQLDVVPGCQGIGWYSNVTSEDKKGTDNRVYIINYTAPKDGQSLTIIWKLLRANGKNASISLYAAILQTFTQNLPPVVKLIKPKANQVFNAPAEVELAVEANDPDGSISKVEYYSWSINLKVAESATPPFSARAKSLGPRVTSFIARAYDNNGQAVDSDPVWVDIRETGKTYPTASKPLESNIISDTIPESGHQGVPNMLELPNGDILCAFYSGKYEVSDNSAIFLSRLKKGSKQWSKPEIIIDTPNESDANVVLFLDRKNVLWAFYTVIEGINFEWAKTYYKTSNDEGKTWSERKPIAHRDFLYQTGNLVAVKPIYTANGNILVPMNRESFDPDPKKGWYSFFCISADGGQTWKESEPIYSLPGNIQPAPQLLDDGSIKCYLRPRGRNAKIWETISKDNGQTWAPLLPSPLNTPSTRNDFVKLKSGNYIVAHNNNGETRNPFSLSLSKDGGKTWITKNLECGYEWDGYPSMIQTKDGKIHVAYDISRLIVKHVVVDEAWFAK